MHTVHDLVQMFTVFTRVARLLNKPTIDCPALPEPLEPFLSTIPEPEQLQAVEPRLIPFAIVSLRNAIQQALSDALSCDRLDVIVRLDSIQNLNPST